MKRRLLDLLADPVSGARLDLRAAGINPADLAHRIETGVLVNHAQRIYYPIVAGVPRMLLFPTPLTRRFATQQRSRLDATLPGYTLPAGTAMPGEEDVLRSFSSEWVNYDWTGESYWDLTADDMYRAMRFMLDLVAQPVTGKLALEVGIGIGGIADAIVRRDGCELVGVDLSYAVDPANRHFSANPFFHIVQASAFALPFRPGAFDLVFSHGVLHHTCSTKAAFDQVARLPRPGGRLYVWVYSPVREARTPGRRAVMRLERLVRPWCWRLPERLQTAALLPMIAAYLVHQNLFADRSKGAVRYGWREAVHAARDRFTPRFAHRHTEEEVGAWFHDTGYTALRRASQRSYVPSCVPENFIAHTGIDGVRLPIPVPAATPAPARVGAPASATSPSG